MIWCHKNNHNDEMVWRGKIITAPERPLQHSTTTRHERVKLVNKPAIRTIVEPVNRGGGIYAILYSPFLGCHANALYSLFVHGRRLPVRALYIVSFVPKLPKLLIKRP